MDRNQLNQITMALSFLSLALSLALTLKGDTASFYLRYTTYLTASIFLVFITVFLMVEIGDPRGRNTR